MQHRKSILPTIMAITVALGCAILGQELHPMEAQVTKSWADLNVPTAWENTIVDLVVPGAGAQPSKVEKVQARKATFRSSIPPYLFSAVAVPDPHTGETYFLAGGRFFISDKAGMKGIRTGLTSLDVARTILTVPTSSIGTSEAIATFMSRVTERAVAEDFEKTSQVRLAVDVPAGFFGDGSQLVAPSLETFDVSDGILRIDLRSHNGTAGSFWVDLTSLKVIRTKFGG